MKQPFTFYTNQLDISGVYSCPEKSEINVENNSNWADCIKYICNYNKCSLQQELMTVLNNKSTINVLNFRTQLLQ